MFTFTLPLYSLAELLTPVVVCEGRLRPSFVLVRVELAPLTRPPRGDWREAWRQGLETLRRCVYLDKDLVLPPMGDSGASETFYVVASLNMEHAGAMTARIRAQLDKIADLKSKSTMTITCAPVELETLAPLPPMPRQVGAVAQQVTDMILSGMGCRKSLGNDTKHIN
jgi:hypothetical protein